MDWVTIGVVSAIVLFGAAIFYKALREPLDLIFSWFGRVFGSIKDKAAEKAESIEEITYR